MPSTTAQAQLRVSTIRHIAISAIAHSGKRGQTIARLTDNPNRFLSAVVNALYGTSYSDLCYGYNAFWSGCLPLLGLGAGGTGLHVGKVDNLDACERFLIAIHCVAFPCRQWVL